MTANTIEDRKRYINEIRSSFNNPQESIRYKDFHTYRGGVSHSDELFRTKSSESVEADEQGVSLVSGFKLRFFVAFSLFMAFVYCDFNKIQVEGYTTEYVYEKLSENISIEKVEEKVLQLLDF